LKNIFKEYQDDLGFPEPRFGDLSRWVEQGVLLLIKQEKKTYEVLRKLSDGREKLVFMLWGSEAQEYTALVDQSKHLVVSSGHPAAPSWGAEVPFLGSRPFSRACDFLDLPKDFWRL
jgi:uracil-DNA glycosylase